MARMARNRSISGLLVCVCISLSLLAGGASAASEEERRKIVTALDATSLSLLVPIILATGSEIVHTLTLVNALAIRLPDLSLAGLEAIVQDLLSNPLVVAVDDDILGTAAEASPVTQADVSADASPAPGLWGTYRIGVPSVQQQQPKPNGAGVTVAVLDTGIDCQHPALRENIVSYKGFSAFAGTNPCVDDNSHGTHVSGTIAAAWEKYEFISVAPKAQLVPVKVLNRDAQGFCSDVVAGIQYVHSKGIKAANMSFGFYRPCNPLQKAIKRLSDKGVIVVASAGNCGAGDEGGDGEGDPPDACDNPSQLGMAYPAAYSQAIAVGAMTKDDQLAYYSLGGGQHGCSRPRRGPGWAHTLHRPRRRPRDEVWDQHGSRPRRRGGRAGVAAKPETFRAGCALSPAVNSLAPR